MKKPPDSTKPAFVYVPVTPGGTACVWLKSPTEDEAWARLLLDASHMPYQGKDGFMRRGYSVERWLDDPSS